ncbi:ABC transporter substrate-binding protein [Acidiferrimicrobium sp. IK]|uniref:ABC transporter substrate-binding protein n=1 Tax=Acidiferrimicrobium sp. IK TaxID=2871700 RepID=UPI0021CAEACD|nr:ABC transporter substrate-binding protein [Acidiferrimicrobium sp. IK]MCU4185380.1 ABC transporter substrate-binding protein [Acidiferrimicrobium sp. IK]
MVLTGVRRVGVGATVGCLSLIAAACGSSTNATKAGSATSVASSATSAGAATSGGGANSSSATETVSVGVLPIADVAPLYLGIKQGFFAQQHLNVVPHSLQGGAAVASAVVGGSLQFGFGATANLVLAKSHNLPLQFIANGDQAAADAAGAWSGILVSGGSGITSISQLAGKTIAANAVQGQNELALDTILTRNGVKPSSVHVVALPFPTMPSALESGQVQAVTEVEPFVSSIEAKGGKLLSPLFQGAQPSEIVAGYFASTSEIQSHTALVQRFVAALNQSLDYAQANPAAARAIIPTYTSIPAAVAAKMTLPVWSSTVDTSTIQAQEQTMQQLGWISSIVPIDQLVWSGAKH